MKGCEVADYQPYFGFFGSIRFLFQSSSTFVSSSTLETSDHESSFPEVDQPPSSELLESVVVSPRSGPAADFQVVLVEIGPPGFGLGINRPVLGSSICFSLSVPFGVEDFFDPIDLGADQTQHTFRTCLVDRVDLICRSRAAILITAKFVLSQELALECPRWDSALQNWRSVRGSAWGHRHTRADVKKTRNESAVRGEERWDRE